jgi:hypothetical protein
VSVCENCATEEEDLTAVWPGDEPRTDQPQLWCPGCLERHAHDLAEEDEEAEEA